MNEILGVWPKVWCSHVINFRWNLRSAYRVTSKDLFFYILSRGVCDLLHELDSNRTYYWGLQDPPNVFKNFGSKFHGELKKRIFHISVLMIFEIRFEKKIFIWTYFLKKHKIAFNLSRWDSQSLGGLGTWSFSSLKFEIYSLFIT